MPGTAPQPVDQWEVFSELPSNSSSSRSLLQVPGTPVGVGAAAVVGPVVGVAVVVGVAEGVVDVDGVAEGVSEVDGVAEGVPEAVGVVEVDGVAEVDVGDPVVQRPGRSREISA